MNDHDRNNDGSGDFDALLGEPFARAWSLAPGDDAARDRLMQRLAVSRAAEAGMLTARRRRLLRAPLADGVVAQTLYRGDGLAARRPGEPLQARLFELAPGARLEAHRLGDAALLRGRHREWLLLRGDLHQASTGERLSVRDYHVTPAGHATPDWASERGALLFLRESDLAAAPGDTPFTVHDDEAGWPAYAPGIERRVLWQRDGQAAMLYRAAPGAQVPQHTHGHDEECLMVDGELFLDDTLLQAGDYQLAQAGTGHRITATDSGVVIYAHGDLDLRFVD
jgi:quercetin dioxygenase-like cupin family protein